MKHAYLITAHGEFDVLKRLITALDHPLNDIYLHIDGKVTNPPEFSVRSSRLFVLQNRIDIRWGDLSQIRCTLLLLNEAISNNKYAYYHTLSGVDMPIKSQEYIHSFFQLNEGKELLGYTQGQIASQIKLKVGIFHLFPKHFRTKNGIVAMSFRMLRFVFKQLQLLIGANRHFGTEFKKGTSWVSITHEFALYVQSKSEEVLRMYHHTFCADEVFMHTLCWNSAFREHIYDAENEANGSQRLVQWIDNQIYDWELKDLPKLKSSKLLFARKFNSKSLDLLDRLSDHIKNS